MDGFNHTEFEQKKRMLLEAQLADNRFEDFFAFDNALCTVDTDIDSELGTKPIEQLVYQYGRSDKSSEVRDGDRGVIYNEELAATSWKIHTFFPTRVVTKNRKITLDAMTGGGWLDRMSAGAARQVYTDCEFQLKKIVAGTGSAGTGDLATIVVLPAGDEFNDSTPVKTFEKYLKEARVTTGGGTCLFICEDVWFALLENASIAENGLNQHSMTDEDFNGWLRARGITDVMISRAKAQSTPAEQGVLSRGYIHAGVCAVGQKGAIIRYALGADGVQYHSMPDDFAMSNYIAARADVDYRLPYKESFVAFQNTLA